MGLAWPVAWTLFSWGEIGGSDDPLVRHCRVGYSPHCTVSKTHNSSRTRNRPSHLQ